MQFSRENKKVSFDCNHCKRIFEIEEDRRLGVKWARCPFCDTVYRYDLSKPFNSINCTDFVAEYGDSDV